MVSQPWSTCAARSLPPLVLIALALASSWLLLQPNSSQLQAGHISSVREDQVVYLSIGVWSQHQEPDRPSGLRWSPVQPSKPNHPMIPSELKPVSRLNSQGKAPSLLFIGDSVNRNMVFQACADVNGTATSYLRNSSSPWIHGGHYFCSSPRLEAAHFFFAGVSLDGPYFEEEAGMHAFPGMPLDTRTRFAEHLVKTRQLFSQGFPDYVVVNSVFWDLGRLEKHEPLPFSFFNSSRFLPFAESWMANVTWILERVHHLFPEASTLLQTNMVPREIPDKLMGGQGCQKMNNLVRFAQSAMREEFRVGLLDIAAMTEDLEHDVKFDVDSFHPSLAVGVALVQALLQF